MPFIILFLLPAAVTCLCLTAGARRRPSLPYLAAAAISAIALCLAVCGLLMVPTDRMQVFSDGGLLRVSYGHSVPALCGGLPLMLGVFLRLFAREETRPLSKPKKRGALSRLPAAAGHALLFVLIFLTQAYIWGVRAYPNTSLEEIIYYLRMPLEGTDAGFVTAVAHSVIAPAIVCLAVLEALILWPGKNAHILRFGKRIAVRFFPLRLPMLAAAPLAVAWLGVLLICADGMLGIADFAKGYFDTSMLIETEYVSPRDVTLAFPQEKRNLITIYLESAETTPQDAANGGVRSENCIPEMTRIAQENVSFSRNDKIVGASIAPGCGWTIAGLVAQSAGLPLKTYNAAEAEGNDGDMFSVFLPGAVTLGDILSEQGYKTFFMAGSDFTFGGRRVYYETHGDYEIWDWISAKEEGKIPQDYRESWGFEDRKLYAFAKEKLTELAAGDQPFHFAMLTVDAHAPGYRCPECPTDHLNAGRDALNYADTLRCGSIQLDAFLSWLKEQPFYENTTVVVTGDHASQQMYFYSDVLDEAYHRNTGEIDRPVYNAFINAMPEPERETDRRFTTMDFFPTTLAAMGVKIEGERLGLGTNLFSGRETLSEQYGEEAFFEELLKRSEFYQEKLLYP